MSETQTAERVRIQRAMQSMRDDDLGFLTPDEVSVYAHCTEAEAREAIRELDEAESNIRATAANYERAQGERDSAIKAAAAAGITQTRIAKLAGVTQGRIAQILKALALTVVLVVLMGGSAQAHMRLVLPDGSTPQPEQRWVDEFRTATPNSTITLRRGEPCPGAGTKQACSIPGTIWLSGCADAALCRHALAYEIAHQISYRMPDWLRWRFEATLHMPATPWFSGAASTGDGGMGEADWADTYSQCAYPDRRLTYGVHIARWLRVKLCGHLFPLASRLASQ